MSSKYFNLIKCYEHHVDKELVYKHLLFERISLKNLKDKFIKIEYSTDYDFNESKTFKVHDCSKYSYTINSFINKLFSKDYIFSPSHIKLRNNLLKEEYIGILLKCSDGDKLILYTINPSTSLFDKITNTLSKNTIHGLKIKQSQIKYSKYLDPCYENVIDKKIHSIMEKETGLPPEIIEYIIQPYYQKDFQTTIFKIDKYDREFLNKTLSIKDEIIYWDDIEMLYIDFGDNITNEYVLPLPKNLKTLILNYEDPFQDTIGLHEIVDIHEDLEHLIILSEDKILLHNPQEEQTFPNLKTLTLRNDYPIIKKEIKNIKESIESDEFRTEQDNLEIEILSREDIISSLKHYKLIGILENIENEEQDKYFSAINYSSPDYEDINYMDELEKLNKIKEQGEQEYELEKYDNNKMENEEKKYLSFISKNKHK